MLKRFIFVLFPLLILLSSCVSVSSGVSTGVMPSWVNDVDSAYPRTRYVAATGFGNSRAMAEGNALAALTSFFGQTLQVERTAASSYQQAILNGAMDGWVETAEMRSNIRSTASMNNLMGAEIKAVWFDSKETFYAVAVMDKANTIRIYNELLQNNLGIINRLMAETSADPVSFKSVICLMFAATLAEINEGYRSIVLLLDGTTNESTITSGAHYRVLAAEIIGRMRIGIRVVNDRNGRIFGAFARCFADWGFESALVQSSFPSAMRYALDVNVGLSPVDLPNNPNVFSRIELAANLADRNNNAVLIPYTFNSREGHTSAAEADNRCIAAAERNINEAFASLLSDYLTQLIPEK